LFLVADFSRNITLSRFPPSPLPTSFDKQLTVSPLP
jgi:hypothetical protein